MFDSHAHYEDIKFDNDRAQLLANLPGLHNISGIVNIGSDLDTSRRSIEIAESYEYIYAAIGVHPHNAKDTPDDYIVSLRELATNKKVVAIGEIGLDYHYNHSPPDRQKEVFFQQMLLAKELNLPIVVHNREAHKDTLDAVLSIPGLKGVFHSYSGSVETAKILIKAGFYISVSGVVTYKNAKTLPEVAKIVDEDKLLIETDCPYLTPHPYRGKRNSSDYLKYTVDKIAEIRNTTPEHIIDITTANANRLFSIGDL